MRKNILVLVGLFVLVSLLTGCSRPASVAPTVLLPTQTPWIQTQEVIVEVEKEVVITATPESIEPEEPAPVEEPEEPELEPVVELEPVQEPLVLEDCPLEDKGVRLEFEGPNEGEFYLLSGLSQDFAAYEGCNFLFEGRQFLTEEHHIWVFEGPDWQLKVREGSLWAYPSDWNMVDFSTEKPPIVAEFVTAKRHNQVANNYDWVIFVHAENSVYEFPAGQETPVVILPDNANFSEPQLIVVQGIWNNKSETFNASIGAEKATTVALLDGRLVFWANAQDNVVYKSVQAWLMPSSWSQDQIKNWAEAQFPNKPLGAYAP